MSNYLHYIPNLNVCDVTITEILPLRNKYYTVYRQVYSMDLQTVYKCCPGWTQMGEEAGCLHSKYAYLGIIFILQTI